MDIYNTLDDAPDDSETYVLTDDHIERLRDGESITIDGLDLRHLTYGSFTEGALVIRDKHLDAIENGDVAAASTVGTIADTRPALI